MKRAFDLLSALGGLLLLSPLLLLAACAVFLEDRHSPLFLGVRVGRFGAAVSHGEVPVNDSECLEERCFFDLGR